MSLDFYLGRRIDSTTGKPVEPPESLLYDASNLTTHAVCVGMTGSGKTGLGAVVLEEAALHGIPALVIDPKGDLTNLALRFPELRTEDFRPWIEPDAATRAGKTPEEYAAAQATLWREGLSSTGQDAERIARLREAAEVTIYTPGSTAGQPVSILGSLACPPDAILGDAEALAEQAETTVASLLGLLEVKAEGNRSREAVFLSTLLHEAWEKRESLDLEELVRRIQKPPFSRVGVLDVEAFFPEKERFALVLALNGLLAAPGFATWREGTPLDVARLLYTPEGKPRLAVFSIAHLSDNERMFFVSLLLGATLAWVRQQSGTSSLRALLYMDEVFGYFPPTANPPSKKPLLILMKQARAFGFGLVLATQNPADLDYKGLSNAGTWFIGRLQTERDKLRLLDGLAGMGLDRSRFDRLLSALGKRVFLMNNVHEKEPQLFSTRWTLSYLAGPLTRDQLRRLPRDDTSPRIADPAQPTEATSSPAGPPLARGVRQVFPKRPEPAARLEPVLLGVATVRYRQGKLDVSREMALAAPFPSGLKGVAWGEADAIVLNDYDETPPSAPDIKWGEVPPEGLRERSYTDWKRDFSSWLGDHHRITLLESEVAGLLSLPGEEEADFRKRLTDPLAEVCGKKTQAIEAKYQRGKASHEKKLATLSDRLKRHEAQAGESRWQAIISALTAILSFLTGRKGLSATTVSRSATAARGMNRSMTRGQQAQATREQLEELEAEGKELEETHEADLSEIRATCDPATTPLTPREIRPTGTGTRVEWVALGWVNLS